MSASSDVQNKVIVSAVRAHEYLVAQDPSFEQKKLDSTFRIDRLRSFIQYDYSIGLRGLVGSRTASPPALYQIE
jgi:hypothetical protein